MPATPRASRSPPTGTVTFLFTDIEGSTALWEQHPEAMRQALAQHDAILRDAIEANDGCIVKTTGDGAHAVFAIAADAIAACLAAQRALQVYPWELRLKSRMALQACRPRQGRSFLHPMPRIDEKPWFPPFRKTHDNFAFGFSPMKDAVSSAGLRAVLKSASV